MAISHVLAAAMVVVGAAVPVTFPPAQDPSLAPLATGKASFNWIPASDPSIEYVGRTFINPDGTRTFDWEGTQIKINVNNSNWVSAVILATGDALGRFIVETNGWETYSFYAAANTVPNNTYMIADQLWATQSIRLINVLEPSFTGAQSRGSNFTFVGFWTNGQATPPTPRTRKIELVGDSISAGYGARGYANPPYGCPVAGMTSVSLRRGRPTPAAARPAPSPPLCRATTTRTTGRWQRRSPRTSSPSRGAARACTRTAATTGRRCRPTTSRRSGVRCCSAGAAGAAQAVGLHVFPPPQATPTPRTGTSRATSPT